MRRDFRPLSLLRYAKLGVIAPSPSITLFPYTKCTDSYAYIDFSESGAQRYS